MSSNFPLNYNNDEICLYTVIAPKGKQILLTVNSFNLADGDILHIYDGEIALGLPELKLKRSRTVATSSSSFDFVAVFETFRSTGQALVLMFLSDEIETDEGFHAALSVVEGMDQIF